MVYGKAIKHGLIDKDMTYAELAVEVKKLTGMYCDTALITRIVNGQFTPDSRPVICGAINEILEISLPSELSNKTDTLEV